LQLYAVDRAVAPFRIKSPVACVSRIPHTEACPLSPISVDGLWGLLCQFCTIDWRLMLVLAVVRQNSARILLTWPWISGESPRPFHTNCSKG